MPQDSDRLMRRSKYADVQSEMTRMVFDGIMPSILTGCASITAATAIMAAHYGDRVMGCLAVAMFLICCVRIAIAHAFLRRYGGEALAGNLDAAAAYRWELVYGVFTIAYTSVIACVTVFDFRYHDYSTQGWCAMGMFAIASGIGARLALRPWISQTAGMIMLLALTYAVLRSDVLMVRCSASSVIAYMLLFCASIRTKHAIVVEQIRSRRKLAELAQQDGLTGLANRRHFESRLGTACRLSEEFGLLYIDLDKFKAVNDTFGHGTGDALLQAVAERLRRAVRGTDLVARIGGDEFAVLQTSPVTEQSAQALARRINEDMAEVFSIDGHRLQIGASIGIRLAMAEDATAENRNATALLHHADSALYRVKKSGGGGFSIEDRKPLGTLQAAS